MVNTLGRFSTIFYNGNDCFDFLFAVDGQIKQMDRKLVPAKGDVKIIQIPL